MSASPPSAMPEMQALPGYKPSGKIGALALPYLVLSLLALPPLAAFLYVRTAHFGGSLFSLVYILVITAALLGALVGAAFYPAIQWGQVRNVTLAMVFGLLAGALALPLAMGLEALDHRDELRQQMPTGNGVIIAGNAPDSVNPSNLDTLSPLQVAQLYWQKKAEGGMELTGRGGSGANITGGTFWAFTGLQWLLATVTSGVAAMLWAGRRYSEEKGRWYVSKMLYTVLPLHLPDLLAAADAGDWARFASIASTSKDPNFKEPKPIITGHYLPGTPGGIIEIRDVVEKNKPIATIFERELTNEEMKQVWPNFRPSVDSIESSKLEADEEGVA